ncbi:MAG: IPT/TIG domain-containing protein [Planctomycetes bacterium]|nr:IPT/TIG domain-containing protein [Planctomycetota bacterium]
MKPRLFNILILAFAALCFCASGANAQLSTSADYQLIDFAVDAGGGGACSIDYSSYLAIGEISSATTASANYEAGMGFLQANDPQPTNAPIVFGVTPNCGPTQGGTPVTVTGLNFNKFGVSNTIAVAVGGNAASGVSVGSDTLLTCTVPAGAAGNQNVAVSSILGTGTLSGGFVYTADLIPYGPGLAGCNGPHVIGATLCPKVNSPGFYITCTNAPPSSAGLGLIGNAQDPFGTDYFSAGIPIYINVFTVTDFFTLDFFSDANGFGAMPAAIPNNPTLIGQSYFVQSIWYWAGQCSLPPLSLSTSPGLQVNIEP